MILFLGCECALHRGEVYYEYAELMSTLNRASVAGVLCKDKWSKPCRQTNSADS